MEFVFNDGGRKAAGYTGNAGDCVARAVAIATEQDYQTVYDALSKLEQGRRRSKHNKRGSRSARDGVQTRTKAFKAYMAGLGWTWTPTMGIGTGCKVHLTDGELPMGRLIVAVSRHMTTVIDGVVHDTHDPQREPQTWFSGEIELDEDGQRRNKIAYVTGGRCVYGYWSKA
jgi:hypothetical protein